MTAAEFAEMTNARRIGPGRWQANCPAHSDRVPSLSIASGSDNRVLLHDWAGCSTASVLAALGLKMADLFIGPAPTKEQLQAQAREDARHDSLARRRRLAHGWACDLIANEEAAIGRLGALLMRSPEDDPVATLYEAELGKLRRAERIEEALRP
jgi:hypothetical protein